MRPHCTPFLLPEGGPPPETVGLLNARQCAPGGADVALVLHLVPDDWLLVPEPECRGVSFMPL